MQHIVAQPWCALPTGRMQHHQNPCRGRGRREVCREEAVFLIKFSSAAILSALMRL
jgi:hypothetical protein